MIRPISLIGPMGPIGPISQKPITKQCTKRILKQMENSFYKIITNEGKVGIGCFSNIKSKNINIPVLITDMDLINEKNHNKIMINLNNALIKIEIEEQIYKIKECNTIIVKIKVNKDIKINYNIH